MKKKNTDFPEEKEPWDSDFYETGSTNPPKDHGGLIAMLLAVAIAVSGAAGIIGAMNLAARSPRNTDPEPEPPAISVEDACETIDVGAMLETVGDLEDLHLPTAENPQISLENSPPSVDNIPQENGIPLQEIYETNIPSVVSITTHTEGGRASGTGVVLSKDGYLVTNAHVVDAALQISVLLSDDRLLSADLIGADAVSDLAVLKVDAEDLVPATFGDSAVLRVGDAVVAIGDPLGAELRGTMTNGIVSAINRDVTTGGRTMTLIQTNAALNSGNSGGPLINCYGQVVGINTMKIGDYMNSAGVEGLGFAIPSSTVRDIADQLIRQGYVSGRPSLGIIGENVSLFYQRYYSLPAGVYITQVEEDSGLDEAGITIGDILLAVDGQRITNTEQLNAILYGYEAGDQVEVIVHHAGRQYAVSLTLSEATS